MVIEVARNDKRKNTLVVQNNVLSGIKGFWLKFFKNILVRNYLFLSKTLLLNSEGVVSHNLLYYQQLFVVRYQVRFYANILFE